MEISLGNKPSSSHFPLYTYTRFLTVPPHFQCTKKLAQPSRIHFTKKSSGKGSSGWLQLVFRCASISWRHVGESVSERLMFLRFCQILGISSGFLQAIFRLSSASLQAHLQAIFRHIGISSGISSGDLQAYLQAMFKHKFRHIFKHIIRHIISLW